MFSLLVDLLLSNPLSLILFIDLALLFCLNLPAFLLFLLNFSLIVKKLFQFLPSVSLVVLISSISVIVKCLEVSLMWSVFCLCLTMFVERIYL